MLKHFVFLILLVGGTQALFGEYDREQDEREYENRQYENRQDQNEYENRQGRQYETPQEQQEYNELQYELMRPLEGEAPQK